MSIFFMDYKYPITECFYSIQGEGYFTGSPAFFIRLAGCNIKCLWCDTKYAWEINNNTGYFTVKQIISKILNTSAKFVVVTGGEPLIYDLNPLTDNLKKYNFFLCLETSGANILSGQWDWITLSPKKHAPPDYKIYNNINELKVIISDKSDLLWAEKNAKLVNKNCKLFLQPEWNNFDKTLSIVLNYIKQNPVWNLSIQIHKFFNIK